MQTFVRTTSGVPRYMPALTGLRAVAAYGVFLHHYNPASPGTFSYRLFHQGYIGVSVFFVLSGFLIHHRYADAYYSHINWSWWQYAVGRISRIFPLYIILLFGTSIIDAILNRPINLLVIMLNFSLLKGFFEKDLFSGIPQSWSLTVELCFYGIAPFLFIGLPRWGVIKLSAGLICLGLLGWATVGQLSEFTHGFLGSVPFVLFYTFFGRSFEFLVGMWLARRLHQNQLPRSKWVTHWGLIIIAVCVGWQVCLPTLTTNSVYLIGSELVCYNNLLPIGVGALIVNLIDQPSFLQRLLAQPIMLRLGRSSYAFYLLHTGVLAHGLQKMGVAEHELLFGWLIVLAYLLYRFVEKPLQEWLHVNQ